MIANGCSSRKSGRTSVRIWIVTTRLAGSLPKDADIVSRTCSGLRGQVGKLLKTGIGLTNALASNVNHLQSTTRFREAGRFSKTSACIQQSIGAHRGHLQSAHWE